MKRTHWIILAVLLIAPIAFTLIYAREFLAVDSALDAGASYDYQAGRADFTQSHPFIPFADRHNTLCTMAAWSSLGAALYSGSCHLEKEDTFGLLRDKTSKSISWDEGVVEGLG